LLDQQNGEIAPGNLGNQRAYLLDVERRQPLGRRIDHDEFRIPISVRRRLGRRR
jgi:hypothetical protein